MFRRNVCLRLLALLSLVLFVGCNSNFNPYPDNTDPNYFQFSTDELVVDVTPNVKSFRIEGKFAHFSEIRPDVTIQREGTTVKHNVHFINDVREGSNCIGDFTILDDKKVYKDVTIIPENITEEVQIIYLKIGRSFYEPEDLTNQLTVILRPVKEV